MSLDTWQTIGTIVALLLVGAYNGWRSMRAEREAVRASANAATAALQATNAATQTVPLSNGFAAEVHRKLDRIEMRLELSLIHI